MTERRQTEVTTPITGPSLSLKERVFPVTLNNFCDREEAWPKGGMKINAPKNRQDKRQRTKGENLKK